MFRQILLISFIRNVWRTVMRICIFISGLKGLSPHSNQHQISPHHINVLEHIQVMRINEMIAKDELS